MAKIGKFQKQKAENFQKTGEILKKWREILITKTGKFQKNGGKISTEKNGKFKKKISEIF